MEKLDVLVLGGAAVDWVARVDALPAKDGLVHARSFDRFPGGSAANVAVGIARLGRRVGFAGKLGDDENGRYLLHAFEQERVDTRGLIVRAGRSTASCFIAVDNHGDRVIFALPGTSLERVAELDQIRLPDRVLFIGPSYVEVAEAAAIAARERGATIFYAPGSGWGLDGMAHLHPVLDQVDVVLVNRAEARELTGLTEPVAAAKLLEQLGPSVVIVTLGAEGASVLANGRELKVPPVTVPKAQDTTGAGDAFAAGLVVGFLEGMDWEIAARLGCATAALKIGHMGARSGLPSRTEVTQFMDERSVP